MKLHRHLCPLLLGGLLLAPATFAQAPAAEPDDLRAVLEMLRSDFNSVKIRTLNEALQLTGPEAEKFWPVYREYEKELGGLADRKLALIREFAGLRGAGTLDAASADALARKWLKVAKDRLALWEKYHRRLSRAVSPIRAAQFLQVEHQLALFVDVNIASEMPLVR